MSQKVFSIGSFTIREYPDNGFVVLNNRVMICTTSAYEFALIDIEKKQRPLVGYDENVQISIQEDNHNARLSYKEMTTTLGAKISNVKYRYANCSHLFWETPDCFMLEKDGWQIEFQQERSNYGFRWKISPMTSPGIPVTEFPSSSINRYLAKRDIENNAMFEYSFPDDKKYKTTRKN